MSPRLVLVIAVLTAGCQDGHRAAPEVERAPAPTAGAASGPRLVRVPGPRLEVPPDAAAAAPAPAPAPAAPPFDSEPRDAMWATETEAAVRTALRGADHVGTLDVTCRTTRCRIVAGSSHGMLSLAAAEVERALAGRARHVVMGAITETANGGTVTVTAVFDRGP
jgi:hypothetical protein